MSQTRITRAPIEGRHNEDPYASARILNAGTYKDLSTVWVTPVKDGKLDLQIMFQSWLPMLTPLNQKVMRLGIKNAEVGQAYEAAVEMILRDPIPWKYMLTLEHDNLPPRDGLLNLYKAMTESDYDVIGGLYWLKGEFGAPMIYGNPEVKGDFTPQPVAEPRGLQRTNGLGMGFNLFKVDMFRKVPQPWFIPPSVVAGIPSDEDASQDLFFYNKAAKHGFKFACDTRIKVGHMNLDTREIW
jgi:hypothetical protein